MREELGARMFLGALRAGRAAHAYLICGPEEGPLQELAMEGAALLLCGEEREAAPCGVCQDCVLFGAGSHPDFFTLLPEPGKKSIGVDAVRAACAQTESRPVRGGRKVAYIPQAERMTPAAQNALLKTLEEPPEGVTFLLTGRESALLPTVRSRCVPIRLQTASALTGEEEALRQEAYEAAAAICRGQGHTLRKFYMDRKDRLDELLAFQSAFFRDACACELSRPPLYPGEEKLLRTGAEQGPRFLTEGIALCAQARTRLKSNAQAALTVDWLLVELERALSR